MWTNHGDPFAGPLVSSNVAVRVLFVFLLLSTNRCNAGKLLRWRCLQCLEDSTSNVWSNLCQTDVPDDGSVATVLLSQFVKGAKLCHDSELQEMEGEDAQTYMITYIYIPTHKTIHMHIHIYMQMHKNIRTGIQIDRYLDIEIRIQYF